jgi:hypothetical protein
VPDDTETISWIADNVEGFAADYPVDVWPDPTVRATDAQAADVMRRMLPRIAARIRQLGSHDT